MGFRAMRGIVFAAIALIATPSLVSAQEITDSPIQVRNAALTSSVERLTAASRTFREAVDALAPTGRRAILTTPDNVNDFDRNTLRVSPSRAGITTSLSRRSVPREGGRISAALCASAPSRLSVPPSRRSCAGGCH